MTLRKSINEAAGLSDEQHCYLTTVGRVSGRKHTIEIWFALSGSSLFMLSGNRDRSDWVRNAMKHPRVTIRIRDRVFEADARIIEDAEEDALARRLLRDKYADPGITWFPDWIVTALPVAFDLM
jgi:deazaflavin-dependent oxidoreductase (nitroreductase family)